MIGSSWLSLAPSSSPSGLVELSDRFFSALRPHSAPLLVIVVEACCNGDEQQEAAQCFVTELVFQSRVTTAFLDCYSKLKRRAKVGSFELVLFHALINRIACMSDFFN